MCCCNCCKRWTYQILKLKVDKNSATATICMFHEHNEIKSCFGGNKGSIFSDLSGVLTILATIYMCVYMLKYTFLNILFYSEIFNHDIFVIIVTLIIIIIIIILLYKYIYIIKYIK